MHPGSRCDIVAIVEAGAAHLAGVFGGWEIILILTIVFLLWAAKDFPSRIAGIREPRDADDNEPLEAKKSGAVYEALTTDNRTAEFVYPHRIDPEPKRALIVFLAQACGLGRIPFAHGTIGSLVGVVWFLTLVGCGNYWYYLAGAFAGIVVSVRLCGVAAKALKQTNPPSIVLDEVAAVPICFLPWVTYSWLAGWSFPAVGKFFSGDAAFGTVAIFALFRLLDTVKPWPIRQSQRVPGGWGIVLDDFLAALYVAAITLLYLGLS